MKVSSWEGLENNQGETLIRLDPGKYLIGLSSDTEQQVVHEFLDAISDYSVADGPDWTVHFWAIQ